MRILAISDNEDQIIWNHWDTAGRARLEGVELILSAGDLKPSYLEFLVTMANVPLLYVRGNHDTVYDRRPPEGCICAEDRIVRLPDPASGRIIRIAGLGGSMRYKDGKDMYTEKEMAVRARRLGLRIRMEELRLFSQESRPIDILLTHAPCRGHGDMEDLPHMGFECFNGLLDRFRPAYHFYGHVHKEYGAPGFSREIIHPSGTDLVNCCGSYILEV